MRLTPMANPSTSAGCPASRACTSWACPGCCAVALRLSGGCGMTPRSSRTTSPRSVSTWPIRMRANVKSAVDFDLSPALLVHAVFDQCPTRFFIDDLRAIVRLGVKLVLLAARFFYRGLAIGAAGGFAGLTGSLHVRWE